MSEILSTLTRDDLFIGATTAWSPKQVFPVSAEMKSHAMDTSDFHLSSFWSMPGANQLKGSAGAMLISQTLAGEEYQDRFNNRALRLRNVVDELSSRDSIFSRSTLLELDAQATAVSRTVAAYQAKQASKLTDFVAENEFYLVGVNREARKTTAQMAFAGRLVAFNAVELGPITELKPVVEGWEGQRGYMPMQGNGSLEVSFSPFIKQ